MLFMEWSNLVFLTRIIEMISGDKECNDRSRHIVISLDIKRHGKLSHTSNSKWSAHAKYIVFQAINKHLIEKH